MSDSDEIWIEENKQEIESLREKNLALALAVEKKDEALGKCKDQAYGGLWWAMLVEITEKALALSTSPAKQIIEDFRKECEAKVLGQFKSWCDGQGSWFYPIAVRALKNFKATASHGKEDQK